MIDPRTKSAKVTLIKGTSILNKAGRFLLRKTKIVTDKEHIAWLKPKPSFQVQELDEKGEIVSDSGELRKSRVKQGKIVKHSQVGDGWGETRMDDEKAELGRKEQEEAYSKIEKQWADEEEAKLKAVSSAPELEVPELSDDDDDDDGDLFADLRDDGEPQNKDDSKIMEEVFSAPKPKVVDWDSGMKVGKLKSILEELGIDPSGMKKAELVLTLESIDDGE